MTAVFLLGTPTFAEIKYKDSSGKWQTYTPPPKQPPGTIRYKTPDMKEPKTWKKPAAAPPGTIQYKDKNGKMKTFKSKVPAKAPAKAPAKVPAKAPKRRR